ncbi:MAG TPA: DUF2291 domain-containing protein [Paenibacillus sp.]|uniref:DUF2291 family protein n=1 Tax=Paenibacillus sp. TaxID=58172 RepID=UPI002CE33482|nr:DUF2291 domain-containing protein [Paenibacillus sp.]HUC92857.1 DUF2291 domain-containing protein [Paenibacillus sp.]
MRETMVQTIKRFPLCLLILCFTLVFTACTVVKIGEEPGNGASGEGAFDPASFVDEEWIKVTPYMKERAVDLAEVLPIIKADPDKAGDTYGIRSGASGSPWNYIVQAEGKVLEVNTESRAGTFEVDLAPYDGQTDFVVQIGPVFKGTSIRDSLDFIKFDDFRNQIQYAQLANAFNKKVNDEVTGSLNPESLRGKVLMVVGAATAEGSSIVMTPVGIEVTEGGR